MDTATTYQPSIPIYDDGMARIYLGESQEILPTLGLRDHDVVHVVTDPPYGIGLDYGDPEDNWRPDYEYWTMLHQQTPENTTLHMTVSNKHLPIWLDDVQTGGWRYLHTSVYWNEGRAGGNWNGQFAYAWEPILHFSKSGKIQLGKRMLSDVFKHDGSRTTQHPAERDISCWKLLLDLMPEGLILDPFMGSGTTLRAALDLGRPAIGIEREERWCREAATRCSQMSLFTSPHKE